MYGLWSHPLQTWYLTTTGLLFAAGQKRVALAQLWAMDRQGAGAGQRSKVAWVVEKIGADGKPEPRLREKIRRAIGRRS